MAGVTFGDDLVRDYLIYRGFLGTVKAFESDVKTDRDRGFRPDRVVEHLSSCITNLDLTGLREAWYQLEQKVFARLEHSFVSHARKLENALLRMYIVTCVSTGRHDKLLDFFEKMAAELQGQSEWKEWFAMPFLKNADENPTFSVFFTRHWQDTMLVSLHNFISVVFQSLGTPSLLSYREHLFRQCALQEENDLLKTKLASVIGEDQSKNSADGDCPEIPASTELMDDFYVIAQEAPNENVGRSIKSLIKNISSGLPSSPILGRHLHEARTDISSGGLKLMKSKPRSPSVPPQPSSHVSSDSTSHMAKHDHPSTSRNIRKESITHDDVKGPTTSRQHSVISHSSHHSSMPLLTDTSGFLMLSQDEYSEHNAFVTHCLFNNSGSLVASSDTSGVLKIWTCLPVTETVTTIMSKSNVVALEWAPKRERLLFHGNVAGKTRLYDTKERRIVGEVASKSSENHKVLCISCNRTEANFAVSVQGSAQGNLSLFDMRTLQLQRELAQLSKGACYCSSFNHNGQLLLVGTLDGHVQIFDLRNFESIASWTAHSNQVSSIQWSQDENTCYTMGHDGKFFQWSINRTGHLLNDLGLHCGMLGPYSKPNMPFGKLFAFNSDSSHVLTYGPAIGGVIYKLFGDMSQSLSLGNHSVTTVDWSFAMKCSVSLCGSTDGRITLTTLLTQ